MCVCVYAFTIIYIHIAIRIYRDLHAIHMFRLGMTERLHQSCSRWALQDAAPEPKKGAKARGLS